MNHGWFILAGMIAASLMMPGCGGGAAKSAKPAPATAPNGNAPNDSSNGNGNSNGNSNAAGGFSLYPEKLISGFDGKNTFKVPVIAQTTGAVTWSLSDPSIGEIVTGSDPTKVMVKTKKAGSATLTAKTSAGSASVKLTVNSYTAEQTAAGKARFNATSSGCKSCHSAGGSGGDNSPTDLGKHTDEEITRTFVEGVSDEGKITEVKHVFSTTEIEKKGLPAYLRSQEPKGYPDPKEDEEKERGREDVD